MYFFYAKSHQRDPDPGSSAIEFHRFDSYDWDHEAHDDLQSLIIQDTAASTFRFVSHKSIQFDLKRSHNSL